MSSQWFLQEGPRRSKGQTEVGGIIMEARRQSHKPRNAGISRSQKSQGNRFLPQPPTEINPADTLTSVKLIGDFRLPELQENMYLWFTLWDKPPKSGITFQQQLKLHSLTFLLINPTSCLKTASSSLSLQQWHTVSQVLSGYNLQRYIPLNSNKVYSS